MGSMMYRVTRCSVCDDGQDDAVLAKGRLRVRQSRGCFGCEEFFPAKPQRPRRQITRLKEKTRAADKQLNPGFRGKGEVFLFARAADADLHLDEVFDGDVRVIGFGLADKIGVDVKDPKLYDLFRG